MITGINGQSEAKSGEYNVRENQNGISATTDTPHVKNIFFKYIPTQCAVAGPHPYRQTCSTAKDKPKAKAQASHTHIFQRMFQNLRATGVCSCSLYFVESKIFKPLPEPLLDKMLNFVAMIAIISQK
jgi:hypothetical protein